MKYFCVGKYLLKFLFLFQLIVLYMLLYIILPLECMYLPKYQFINCVEVLSLSLNISLLIKSETCSPMCKRVSNASK